MVKELAKKEHQLFVCEMCGYAYEDRQWAEKCEAWCKKYQSCNLDITEHCVPLNEPDE